MMQANALTGHSKKIDSLQALRALAFMGVFVCHAGIADFGAWAVSVFFVLSGFLMTYSYYGRTLDSSAGGCIRFAVKKMKKIYILHIVMMVLMLLFKEEILTQSFSGRDIVVLLGKLFLNVTLLQAWVPSPYGYFSLNGVAWYLSACLFIYAIFPKILPYIKKMNVRSCLWIMVCVYLLQIAAGWISGFISFSNFYFQNFPKWFTYIFPLYRLGDFAAGCCLGVLYIRGKLKIRKLTATLLELLMFGLVFLAMYFYENRVSVFGMECFRYVVVFLPIAVGFVALFAVGEGMISKVLSCKPMVHLGNLSAYAFLIHLVSNRVLELFSESPLEIHMGVYSKAFWGFILVIVCSELYMRLENMVFRGKNV